MTDTDDTSTCASVRAAGKQILNAGGEVASRAELLAYLQELGTVASAIQHGLIHAAWRGQLTEGAALDELPLSKDVERKLSLRDIGTDGRTPGDGVFSLAILNAIHLARQLGELASTAWAAGIAEDTRVQLDEALATRRHDDVEIYKEFMDGIARALKGSVPEDSRDEVAAALRGELELIRQRRTEAAAALQG